MRINDSQAVIGIKQISLIYRQILRIKKYKTNKKHQSMIDALYISFNSLSYLS